MGVLRSNSLDHTRVTMAELGLKKKEIEAIDFAFDVYDFKGDGKVDAFYAGDLIRACNLNPTLKTIAEIGGTTEKGQKMLTKADVFPMYKACKDSKDQGGFHDFVEILKLYDKNDENTMLAHELFRLLTTLGEKLTKEEAKSLMKELCEPADDEGFMPFIPFLERMCAAEKYIFFTSTTICLYHLELPRAAPPQQYTNDFLRLSLRGVRAGRGGNELEHSRISYIVTLK